MSVCVFGGEGVDSLFSPYVSRSRGATPEFDVLPEILDLESQVIIGWDLQGVALGEGISMFCG